MTRFYLPFDEHWLSIGDSYSGLHEHMEMWLAHFCPDYVFGFNGEGYPNDYLGYYIDFTSEKDCTLFLLKWSSDEQVV